MQRTVHQTLAGLALSVTIDEFFEVARMHADETTDADGGD